MVHIIGEGFIIVIENCFQRVNCGLQSCNNKLQISTHIALCKFANAVGHFGKRVIDEFLCVTVGAKREEQPGLSNIRNIFCMT